ncbi:MAG: hypothetical protein MUC63_04125 [Planctomycetes bacterium]|nr:hypothetical protein [Planctomycetota bacterium]
MAIVELNARHHERVMALLRRDPARTVFLVGDIENFGYKTDFQDVWGEVAGEEIRAVLLRYFGHFLIHAQGPFDLDEFARVIEGGPAVDQLSGSPEACEPLARRLGFKKLRTLRLLALDPGGFRFGAAAGVGPRRAAVADLDAMLAFQSSIPEFGRGEAARDGIRKNLESGTGRTYLVEDGGEIVATASSAACAMARPSASSTTTRWRERST